MVPTVLALIKNRQILTSFPTIYFINTNSSDNKLNLRTLCAIESASLHNPDSLIKFYTLSSINSDSVIEISKIPNVTTQLTTAEDILDNTPLSQWYSRGDYKNGPYEITHLSDAMRLALLWKRGGIYMDTDIWSVKGISNMSNNIAREDDRHVNGAVMIFDKHHPFLYDCMVQFVLGYKRDQFIAQGPGLLTKVMPIKMVYKWKLAYTFHLWNKVSGKVIAKIGNKLFLEELAKKNCPTVYKLMISMKILFQFTKLDLTSTQNLPSI
uniref:Alpha 1,4-glycosyltransferase domain-containing protein n=1 Tax=Strigamia maritima TaxID=126957 RepID=T1J5G6_STRMM